MSLHTRLSELRLAVALLTRLPVGRIAPCPPMGAGVWAFPLAGLVPGLACGLALWAALALGLPALAAGFIAVAAAAAVTGGMHEDGLADLIDGLSGGRNPEQRLKIMRDSRVGSHGALALMLAVGLRASALAALDGAAAVAVPVAAAALSRGGLGLVMLALRPARPDGLGAAAAEGLTPTRAWAAAGLSAAMAAACGPGWAVALPAAMLATALIAAHARRRLGGYTGDVLGAAQVAAEVGALLAMCRV